MILKSLNEYTEEVSYARIRNEMWDTITDEKVAEQKDKLNKSARYKAMLYLSYQLTNVLLWLAFFENWYAFTFENGTCLSPLIWLCMLVFAGVFAYVYYYACEQVDQDSKLLTYMTRIMLEKKGEDPTDNEGEDRDD